jgi:hypothetical protein
MSLSVIYKNKLTNVFFENRDILESCFVFLHMLFKSGRKKFISQAPNGEEDMADSAHNLSVSSLFTPPT